ncbi:uncharacterized protein LOC110934126 [Helianthus annuus]|uniref:uncharacterized protein LOC110934126 n=1 Tax=Helianthus annuus TaxID=4232 RepID=UPI000B903F28|nr:uncharacterized protein LOC110934126 [Helianthus annuus]
MPHLRSHGPPPKPPVTESSLSSRLGQGPQVSISSTSQFPNFNSTPLPTPPQSPKTSPNISPPDSPTFSTSSIPENLEEMANPRQTVHQQATQNFTGLASPITVPPIVNDNSWQIPSYAMEAITNSIQFHGREDEDAPAHINRFSRILATFSLQGAPNDVTYLQLFPFSLAGCAATWLDSQPTGGSQGRGQPSGFGNNNFGSGWRNNNNNFASNNNFRLTGPPGFQIAQNPNRGLGSLFGGGSNGQVNDGGSSSQVQTGQGSSYDLGGSLERIEAMMSQLVVRDQSTQKKLSEHDLMLKNHQAAFQDLQRVVGDMSRKLEDRLPSQFAGNTQPNPNAHVKAITTRSGKTVGNPSIKERVVDEDGDILDEETEMEAPSKVQSRLRPASTAQPGESQGEKRVEKPPIDVRPSPLVNHAYVSFPSRLKNQKYSREYGQFLDIFKQLKINLLFIEALQSMPKYAKFLKDLLRNKEKLGELSNVPLHGGCSAVVSNRLPEKLTDPGVFTITCLFGSNTNTRALADLGASINLMPFPLYEKLDLGELSPTRMTLSLADRSVKHPRGIVENLLVKVDKFVFPADFVILDMEADENVP